MRAYTLLTFLFLFCFSIAFGQGTQIEFGKNRVQYHDDFKEWLQYETPNFTTYWYGKSRNVGQAVVQMAELDHDAIQNVLEHRINDKIEIIVYADITDLKQSNIGSEEAFVNNGGQTKIVGNKVFVYFDGNHNHLRQQIREGIASVYLNAMLFGSNIQEIVQNAVMMNLPDWFEQGLVSYVGTDWDTDIDNQMKDVLMNEDFKDFEAFAQKHPKLAGHSLWYYIGQNYGKSTVSNLLYLTRINRSIESGFLYVLGSSYEKVIESWQIYFNERYQQDAIGRNELTEGKIEIKNRRKLPISQVKLSPDGQYLAYVTNEIGKYKVYLQEVATGEREVIHKGEFRNAFQATDYNYPLVAWKPNNMEISMIYEKRDVIKYLNYNPTTKETFSEDLDPQYQRILSMDYMDNTNMVFSAIVGGYSDIFIYQTLNRQTQRITSDYHDDLDVSFVKIENKRGILFSSNRIEPIFARERMDTLLPITNFDIFYYNLEDKSKELVQVTNTPFANERYPVAIDTTWFGFTSDLNGINNKQIAYLDDVFQYNEQIITLKDGTEMIIHQDSTLNEALDSLIENIELRPLYKKEAFVFNNSNYSRSLVELHAAPRVNKTAELIFKDGIYQCFIHPIDTTSRIEVPFTEYKSQQNNSRQILDGLIDNTTPSGNETSVAAPLEDDIIDLSDLPIEKKDTTPVDIDNYLFQSEFDTEEAPPIVKAEKDEGEIVLERVPQLEIESVVEEPKVIKFNPSRITPYRTKFRTDFVTTQMDNSLLFGGLDTYAGESQQYSYPPPGILMKANFKDLFEDYQLEGGVRFPTTFNGAEYFMVFDNKKKRLDQRFAVYRRMLRDREESNTSIQPLRSENVTLLGMGEVRYPLDIFRSLRGSVTLRNDKRIQLATERNSLVTPTDNEQRIGMRLEYVFDNTLDVSVNIKNGTRYKVFAEMVKRFDLELIDGFDLSFNEGFMTVVGLDARHYQRLDKHSIFAMRVAGATTFGSENILYLLGGVDNWLLPKFNDEIPLPTEDTFAYQTLASNLRGFEQNIRNGSTYALFNAELRVPLIRYFFRKNLRSAFLRNFQVVGFFDAGTAWTGTTPFSDDNPLNIVMIEDPQSPVSVKVNYFRDPIVAGYGVGVRSMLFGYFIRLDYAWGVETRQVQEPRFHLSLGMDF